MAEKPGYYVNSPITNGDGEWIAFTLIPTENYAPEPWLVNINSGELTQISIPGGRPYFWNPTGDKLVLSVSKIQEIDDVYLYDLTANEAVLLLENLSGRALEWVYGR